MKKNPILFGTFIALGFWPPVFFLKKTRNVKIGNLRSRDIYALIGGMSAKRQKIKERDLRGFKYFKSLSALLKGLHSAGCERDRAGNRTLFMDQYVSLLLLYMFNPICSSIRSLQQAGELKKVQRLLGCSRASLGSLSEASRVFESSLLEPIIAQLTEQLGPISQDKKLEVGQVITLVDGSSIQALQKLTQAAWDTDKPGIKAHTQFDLEKYVPLKINISEDKSDERKVFLENLQPGRIYVNDRGYACFKLFQAIVDSKSSFVCRLREDTVYETIQEKPLTEDARKAGIIFDRTVIAGSSEKLREDFKQPLRLIAVECQPHLKRGQGPRQSEMILIATDRLDLDAEVIALLYQKRWAIEIFFRFFKHVLGCRHLLSLCENGIELQMYAAIIACMLISLWTGKKPTLRTYEMLCWHLCGMADEQEMQNHINKLQSQN